MAHKDDVTRILAACEACGSVYAAREWPDGTIRLIGQQDCPCGASTFVAVDDEGGGTESGASAE